jgi:hypothetical protein
MKKTTRLISIFAVMKLRFQRGQAYLGLIQQAISLLILVRVWGIRTRWVVPAFLVMLACTYLVGWLDERMGIWRAENLYQQTELSPTWWVQMGRLDDIERALKTLQKTPNNSE